ncbi:MAG: hypothetical protein MHM6MM_004796 [Cercozoa sp. M6MM]
MAISWSSAQVSTYPAYNNDEVTFDSLIVNGIDVRQPNSTKKVVQSHVIMYTCFFASLLVV